MVRRADMPTISGLCSLIASTNFSGGMSTPRSITSKPALRRIMQTKFFPISCRSPWTVPITITPADFMSSPLTAGLTTSTPAFIALADIITSGTNISPSLNFVPTIFIPAIKPSLIIDNGSSPAATKDSARFLTFSTFPSKTAF